jgi:hypothetical protein
MPKVTLVYTVFRQVKLDQVDDVDIMELQSEDKSKLRASGFEIEDPTWEVDDDDSEVDNPSPKLEGP